MFIDGVYRGARTDRKHWNVAKTIEDTRNNVLDVLTTGMQSNFCTDARERARVHAWQVAIYVHVISYRSLLLAIWQDGNNVSFLIFPALSSSSSLLSFSHLSSFFPIFRA